MTTIDPIIAALSGAGATAAAAWGIWSKLRANHAQDAAAVAQSAAVEALWAKVERDIEAADRRVSAAEERIGALAREVIDLRTGLAQCQSKHEERDRRDAEQAAEDARARAGLIDRRKPQPAAGRRTRSK